jgi:hypothetical protein
MMLLSVSRSAPNNLVMFNSVVSNFAQKDVYPTDEIYQVFDFSESESPVDIFEDLGYEGGNFIELTGSLFINFVVGIALWAANKGLKWTFKKLHRFEFIRK